MKRFRLPRAVPWLLTLVWLTGVAVGQGLAADAPASEPLVDADVQRLIVQLGDDSYYVREQAQAELEKIGFRAFDALSAATAHEDYEVATRSQFVLARMLIDMADPNDPPEVKPLLADYEGQPDDEKLGRMKGLADLPGGAGWPALVRLVRYERSTVLAKRAAMELLRASNDGTEPPGKALEAIRSLLPRSPRSPAKWLLAWADSIDNPKAALTRLGELIAAEKDLLKRTSGETSHEIVASLLRLQFECLKRENLTQEAVAAMRQLIEIEPGNPASLGDLLDWLIKQKAWAEIDALAKQFHAFFETYPPLGYALAQSRLAQGDNEGAAKLAAKAFAVRPGSDPNMLMEHLRTAMVLGTRGCVDWAVREYRHVIATSKDGHFLALMAHIQLSELYHDQARDHEAGEQLEAAMKTAERKPDRDRLPTIAGRTVEEVASRKHYFLALDHAANNRPKQQKTELLAGLRFASPDIDLLITARGLADLSKDEEALLTEKLSRSIADLQLAIDADPNSSQAYNEYAWLVGNTARDPESLDLALERSQQSLKLRPGTAGYYDTLAHVYFAKGDYENAVHYQTKAAELEPHSGLITRKLGVFSKKLAETKAASEKKEATEKP